MVELDTVAAGGDDERRAAIERWITAGSMRVAVAADEIVGSASLNVPSSATGSLRCSWSRKTPEAKASAPSYCWTHSGSETRPSCSHRRICLTSPCSLLTRLGWRSVGIVYGLDEGDPELFYLAPGAITGLS